PVTRTPIAPAASAASNTRRVRSEMLPSLRTIVPSRSVATTRGAFMATALRGGLENVHAEERLQRNRNANGAVGLLMHLEQARDRPRDRAQGPVEGCEWFDTICGAHADVQPSRLERRAVRRARQLAVAPLRREPCLAVVLARRTRP